AGVLDTFAEMGFDVGPGRLGENLTVRGIKLDELRPGDRLYIGDVIVEATENREPCTTLPTVDNRLLKEMVGNSGLLARVLCGGTLRPGMPVQAEKAEMPAGHRTELSEEVLDAAL